MSSFGVTKLGFKPMALTEVQADLQAALRTSFGGNISLAPESVFGQLVAIMAERHAALWQLGQAVYNASNPAAASGLAVDNILALNNLQRLPARPTVTAPQPTQNAQRVTLYGLVLYGEPGTIVPAGALVSDGKAIPVNFALDATVTIGSPSNARQSLSFSNRPDTGTYRLTFVDGEGRSATTDALAYGQMPDALQAAVRALSVGEGEAAVLPFGDVGVSATATGYQFDFGAAEVERGAPTTAAQAIPLLAVAESSLAAAGASTNLTVLESRVGAPAQAPASAKATTTGPNVVLAGGINTIVTPQIGWTGVTNQLDCLTGAALETDEQALTRFRALRASQGSGSLAAIVQRVLRVAGVTAATGYQNLTNAAQQTLTFGGTATGGSYQLSTGTGTTQPIAFDATAGQLQAALAAIAGFEPIRVSGTASYGFAVDFNGAQGGQAQPLLAVTNNGTGAALTPAFGRPAHSVEVVVSGGDDLAVADAILNSLPAGVSSYGAPVINTFASIARGSTALSVADANGAESGMSVAMAGLPMGTLIASISGSEIVLTQSALQTLSNAPCVINHSPVLVDSAGNTQAIGFSRPTPTLIYVQVTLITDQYVVPGDRSSGVNAASKWSPNSVSTIQNNLLAIGNAIPTGGLIVAQGTNGLVGSFNAVPGIVSFRLTFGTQPNPSNVENLQMQVSQAPLFQASDIAVAYQ